MTQRFDVVFRLLGTVLVAKSSLGQGGVRRFCFYPLLWKHEQFSQGWNKQPTQHSVKRALCEMCGIIQYDTGEYYCLLYCIELFIVWLFSTVWNHIMWQCDGEYDCPLTMYEYCNACGANKTNKATKMTKMSYGVIHIPWRSWLLFFGFVFLWGFALFQEFHRAFALKWEKQVFAQVFNQQVWKKTSKKCCLRCATFFWPTIKVVCKLS